MSQNPKYALPINEPDQPTWARGALGFFTVVLFPFYLLIRFVEEISGEGRWYRRQRHAINNRTHSPIGHLTLPLPDEKLKLWASVRRAIADSVGVHPDTIRPDDTMSTFWRMQLSGPDPVDVLFRLEKQLNCKINVRHTDPSLYSAETFNSFALCVIEKHLANRE